MLRNRKGFTLIELLIVVVIIGILAAIAIPKFSKTREKAYFSSMKSDLKNLAAQQEIYYSANNYTYTDDLNALQFKPSQGVTINFGAVTDTSWAAQAVHAAFGDDVAKSCAIHYGTDAPAFTYDSVAGVVTCTGE